MRIDEEIKSKFDNEHHRALINLLYTNYQLAEKMRVHFKKYGITTQQFNVLRILRGQQPNPASIGLMKERMLDKSSDVSRMVDRLLLKKLIERTECKSDRRQKDVIITKKGLDLLIKIDKEDKRADIMINLTEAEAKQLNSLLDKLRN